MTGAEHRKFRALFISDIHLGSKPAKAEFLIDFLRYHDAEQIYLVGDIVDGWRLKRSWHWPAAHNDVVQKLLRKARKGAEITYIAGNHDEFLRSFQGVHFGGIVVADRVIHEAADGRRFLVIHGDQFDQVVHNVRWLAYLGDKAYDLAIVINRVHRTRAAVSSASILVVLFLGKDQGQEGGQVHKLVPGRACPGSPALRG